jgi:hypothetical protein
VYISNARRLSRRRFISLAGGVAGALALGGQAQAATGDVRLPAPYLPQGGTGSNEGVNCGPASAAMAVNYSGAAFPTVADVRARLGVNGPTDIDQWAWLLDVYGVPWYSTWSQWEMDTALRQGHALVVASWMADLSPADDFEKAYAENWGWSGRYDSFSGGHAMFVVGTADGGANYLVHDPNVFPGSGSYYYGDGSPKGAFRKYSSVELWNTVAAYASGLALAVVPPVSPTISAPKPAAAVKRIRPSRDGVFAGPGGGQKARRGLTSEIIPAHKRDKDE